MPHIEQIAWWMNAGLTVVLVVRLTQSGLLRIYKWFYVQLIFQAVQNLGMLPLDPATNVYAWAYLLTQPLSWVLYILVVLELYSLALRNHPGLASLSHWVVTAAMIIAVALSALSLSADLSQPAGPYPVLVFYGVAERGISFSLVLFLIVIIGFLLWTPVPMRRNIALHACLYTTYFLASAGALFLRNILGYHMVAAVSVAQLSINNLCLLLWILLLNPKGEQTPIVARRLWRRSEEDLITRQLDAVNAFLLRSAGRHDR